MPGLNLYEERGPFVGVGWNFIRELQNYGWLPKGLGLKLFLWRRGLLKDRPFRFRFRGMSILLRPSDICLFADIFYRGEYHAALSHREKKWLDGGAHIGLFTLWLRPSYVVAIEPEKENFDLLQKNLEANRIPGVAVNAAIWNSRTTLPLNLHRSSDGHTLIEGKSGIRSQQAVQTVTLGDFDFDCAKLDIEGAEMHIELPENKFIIMEKHWPRKEIVVLEPKGEKPS